MKEWQDFLSAGVLVLLRVSGLFVFAPVFSSPAIAARIKAGFAFAISLLMTPAMLDRRGGHLELGVTTVLSELAVGLLFGVSLTLLTEMVLFASTVLGMQFSFSLVNLIDPVSKVETPVMGQLFGWMTTLVLLGAGLHRTILAALLKSFDAIPVGAFVMSQMSGLRLLHMASGIFLAGVQLASPVMAAALLVEVTAALMGRISPSLPTTILSVPAKTLICYGVLIGSLGLWPIFLERHFDSLLNAAAQLLTR
ncbi:flagellar biosynthetic protein FliR [Granulicella cerasi]|uniref:Flagellar biosynthetic protein FliR n=1 Tax=Granulicella cerasi TaxID=741063 RepID=A0ABW1Z5M6_9BACT|nr:flagellar biosynthetic protein FliR [Granulicella cerasi]